MEARRTRPILIAGGAALAAVLLVAAVLIAGSRDGEAPPARAARPWVDLTPQQLRERMASEDLVLVNVHVPYEGELPDTDVFVPYDQIGARLGELPADRGAPIVVYCRSGRMSEEAARVLAAAGFTNVSNLLGGFTAWEAAGYPLIVDAPAQESPA